MADTVVVSLGGSMINSTGTPDVDFIRAFARAIKGFRGKLVIATGGGYFARSYPYALRQLGVSEMDCHEVGTRVTHVNALYVAHALNALGFKVCPLLFADSDFVSKVKCSLDNYDVVVLGGTVPGVTTDTDAVMAALGIGADRLVNVSNVAGVYTADPRKDSRAKKIPHMTHKELLGIVARSATGEAGEHIVFDLLATKMAEGSKLELHFVSGKDMDDVKSAIFGKKHGGTVVKD